MIFFYLSLQKVKYLINCFVLFRFLNGVKTMTRDSISDLPVLKFMLMNSFQMQCDCHLFDAFYSFLKRNPGNKVQTAICGSPLALASFSITSTDKMKSRSKDFICSELKVVFTQYTSE